MTTYKRMVIQILGKYYTVTSSEDNNSARIHFQYLCHVSSSYNIFIHAMGQKIYACK